MPISDAFARLESEVEKNPTSEVARVNLLEALSADPERFADPRRFELVGSFLEHHPHHSICSTPLMRVSPESAPGAYAKLKARWLELVAGSPTDSQLVRGAAAFVAAEGLDEGTRVLRAALAQKPDDAKLWLDLGRMSQDPRERLAAFEKHGMLAKRFQTCSSGLPRHRSPHRRTSSRGARLAHTAERDRIRRRRGVPGRGSTTSRYGSNGRCSGPPTFAQDPGEGCPP